MFKTVFVLGLILILLKPALAQEKIIDNIGVELGIISWTDIQKELTEKPKTHTEEYHITMAKKMAQMHGGGVEGSYHILVVLIDKSSGKRIKDAEVQVTAVSKTGLEKVSHKLQFMTMDNFPGYGQFFRLSYKSAPYLFEVEISLKKEKKNYKVQFEESLSCSPRRCYHARKYDAWQS